MNLKRIRQIGVVAALGMVTTALTAAVAAASPGPAAIAAASMHTRTPIKHVVIIIGENHSFDNVFATYTPPGDQHIWNLMSKGIVTRDGNPGPNFATASQLTATNTTKYTLTPTITGAYTTLPPPNTTYVSSACDGRAAAAQELIDHHHAGLIMETRSCRARSDARENGERRITGGCRV
jgi:phospholipase C